VLNDYTKKWCPFARVVYAPRAKAEDSPTVVASYNRASDDNSLSNCLGEGCALWDHEKQKPGCR